MDGAASELACVHDESVKMDVNANLVACFSSVLFCFEAKQASMTPVDETGL